jgi:autotransporter passenger strand-loop-strand repeat protein
VLSATTRGTTVNSGATLNLSAGAMADVTIVNVGGTENVLSGAITSGTTVNSGGIENVYGTDQFSIINSGGMEFIYGATATVSATGGTVTLVGTGNNLITNQSDFGATINGFGSGGNVIDLASFKFSSGTQVAYAADTDKLTLTQGNRSASMTVTGDYAARNFALNDDGSGGTAITYRPQPNQG